MLERPEDNPRPTVLRHRGEYTNPKHIVSPGIPELFGLPVDQEPTNRLEFARWLASTNNLLGDRVTVNRAWRSFFGYGLIRTSGDFGTQSAAPDHPQLLDWLALEFRKNGMSLKKLHRLIATSSTYRQDSQVSEELLKNDPQNRLLARGPRFRLSGELIRDHMLKASGKLSAKMFGPGVYPPQPLSVLAHAFGNKGWNASKGEDRYRRSVYTFVKRTAPFAGHMTFDGTSGENCLARTGPEQHPPTSPHSPERRDVPRACPGRRRRSSPAKEGSCPHSLPALPYPSPKLGRNQNPPSLPGPANRTPEERGAQTRGNRR